MADSPILPGRVGPLPSDRAWFDPALVTANLYTRVTDITFTAPGALPAAKLDHTRWAIGFIPASLIPPGLFCAPWSEDGNFFGFDITSAVPPWFNLTTHGSLVVDAWYVSAGGTGIVRVVEILRQTRGG